MTFPVFLAGDVLRAQDMNAVGLWLVKSQVVGTGVSSVTVTGAFSADYTNYKIIWTGGFGSGSSGLALRFGASTTNYSHVLIWGSTGGTTVNIDSSASTNQINYIGGFTTSSCALSVDVTNPFIAGLRTGVMGGSYLSNDYGVCNGRHDIAQSNTSFVLLPLSGTITGGTISVYGYKQ